MNTKFHYLYRDGSNYKSWCDVTFEGPPTEALRKRLVAALEGSELFIAEQIRTPECFFDYWPVYIDDHCWHEFNSLEPTVDAPDDKYRRTTEQFVLEVERASARGWKVFDPYERSTAGRRKNET